MILKEALTHLRQGNTPLVLVICVDLTQRSSLGIIKTFANDLSNEGFFNLNP